MDQKKMFLALGLSVALMWLWSMFFMPEKQPVTQAPPAQKAAQPQVDPRTQAPPVATAPQSGQQAPLAQAPAAPVKKPVSNLAKEVRVQTPLYTAIFSTRGGNLQKLILHDYYNETEKQGGNFAVLDLDKNGPLSVAFGLDKLDPQLNNRIFTPSADSLNLSRGVKSITFSAKTGGVTIEKTYTFHSDSYAWDLKVRLLNHGGASLELQPSLSLVEKRDRAEAAMYAFTGMQYTKDGKYQELDAGDLEDNPSDGGAINYLGLSIPYFMGALAPEVKSGNIPIKRYVRGSEKDGLMTATLVDSPLVLEPGRAAELDYLVFYGPKDLDILEPLGHDLASAVDFGWFDIIAKPMLIGLKFCFSFTGNWGLAIIIMTLLTKLIFWPLTKKSYQSMKKMQSLQPHVKKLREKYKDDKQRMNQEIMQLYKTYKVNPAGGCLPMVVQIPVFIAFYKVLGNSIELRHAPFLWWINDLSSPDRLPIGFDIPYVGAGLPVLTLLMGASMFLQQKMTPTTGDPTQAKMMMLMPVVFTVMFINFPAGLVLYWLVNNLFSIGQQTLTNRSKKQ